MCGAAFILNSLIILYKHTLIWGYIDRQTDRQTRSQSFNHCRGYINRIAFISFWNYIKSSQYFFFVVKIFVYFSLGEAFSFSLLFAAPEMCSKVINYVYKFHYKFYLRVIQLPSSHNCLIVDRISQR